VVAQAFYGPRGNPVIPLTVLKQSSE